MNRQTLKKLLNLSLIIALAVILLGAFTRLSDAGLGCPDWPGCYGHLVLPTTHERLQDAQMAYPSIPIEQHKAWTEMVHRYAAGSLGLLILTLSFFTFCNYLKGESYPIHIALLLMAVLVFQAALGMWTVTLKLLPVVVMGHLLGGMILLSLLGWYRFSLKKAPPSSPRKTETSDKSKPIDSRWLILGICIVFGQIALGGWVSSNYAGLACVGFPLCNGHLIPQMDFQQGFNLFNGVGANNLGGVLDSSARVTVQVVHRLGAVITVCYLFGLSSLILCKVGCRRLRIAASICLLLVTLQFGLGVLNVVSLLPLPVAVAHNGVAALLLLAVVALTTLYNQEYACDSN